MYVYVPECSWHKSSHMKLNLLLSLFQLIIRGADSALREFSVVEFEPASSSRGMWACFQLSENFQLWNMSLLPPLLLLWVQALWAVDSKTGRGLCALCAECKEVWELWEPWEGSEKWHVFFVMLEELYLIKVFGRDGKNTKIMLANSIASDYYKLEYVLLRIKLQ